MVISSQQYINIKVPCENYSKILQDTQRSYISRYVYTWYEMILFFVNNATVFFKGTHWSVMLFFPEEAAFDHVDTILNGNENTS